ncbi:MAG: FAD-dependent oxidoreductase [Bacteroidales bacterium]|nr:FAD-dependent oxidoreductase [Bacteroidales bacterium]
MAFFDIKGLVNPLSTLKQFGNKPHTVEYPKKHKETADRYRGLHFNDLEACIGCGNCSTICMNEAIDMIHLDNIEGSEGDSGLRPRVDNGRCCWCALCVEVCPTGSLNMTKQDIFISSDADAFLWTPGVSNPEGKDILSFTSDEKTSLSLFDRVPMPEMEGEERVKSFAETMLYYTEEAAREEASRCISCSLCTEVCPDHMHIPEYINAIARGEDEDSIRIIYDNNPLGEMCGKVCTRRCEDVCALQVRGDAVAIRWLKEYAMSRAETADILKEIVNPDIQPANGKKIGIVGGGPAGLTAGYYLALKGFDVTIFEANEYAGGMVMYGIPKYRLPMDSLNKQIDYMKSIGVKIQFNTKVGKDISFDDIYKNHDAVFVGVGFQKPYNIGIDGEEANGVIPAVSLLFDVNSGKTPDLGHKVVVIGGGNVAIDGARVSRRLGSEVVIMYRRRVEDMPADWEEIEGAEVEAVDIMPQTIPIEIISDENNKVTGIKYLKAEMKADAGGGRPRPVPIEGSEAIMEVSTVIGAIGQEADYSFLSDEYMNKIEINRGRMVVNDQQQTKDPKIFAGGDAVNRTADAISAIADGYRAVKAIEKWLMK